MTEVDTGQVPEINKYEKTEGRIMKKFAKVMMYLCGIIPAVALVLGRVSVAHACIIWFFQPKVPAGLMPDEDRK